MALQQLYRELEQLYADMAAAATGSDWDRLVALEAGTQPIVQKLMNGPAVSSLAAPAQEQIAQTIERIQAHDAVIRAHVSPHLEAARKQLGDAAREQRLQASYGSHSTPE